MASRESDERSRKLQEQLDEAMREAAQQQEAFATEIDAREEVFRHDSTVLAWYSMDLMAMLTKVCAGGHIASRYRNRDVPETASDLLSSRGARQLTSEGDTSNTASIIFMPWNARDL